MRGDRRLFSAVVFLSLGGLQCNPWHPSDQPCPDRAAAPLPAFPALLPPGTEELPPGALPALDLTPPAAPVGLRVSPVPVKVADYILHWTLSGSGPVVARCAIYESDAPITEENRATALRWLVEGPAVHGPINLQSETGVRHFRVAAISEAGVEGALSEELPIDTTPRLLIDLQYYYSPYHLVATWTLGDSAMDLRTADIPGLQSAECAEWSPDGRFLAFVGHGPVNGQTAPPSLYLAPAVGAAQRVSHPLADALGVPAFAWSPAGDRIGLLLASCADCGARQALLRPSTGELTEIPGEQAAYNPRWSPDGHWFCFTNADGLHTAASAENPPNRLTPYVSSYDWSPVSSRIAVYTDIDVDNDNDVAIVYPQGGPYDILEATMPDNITVKWSPDGRWLAVNRLHVSAGSSIHLMPAGGGSPVPVSDLMQVTPDILNFRWSPDSKRFGFLNREDYNIALYLCVINEGVVGSPYDPLPGRSVGFFAWSPDGQRIAFTPGWGSTPPDNRVYVARLDGSAPYQVSVPSMQGDVTRIIWSPDGSKIAYTAGSFKFTHPPLGYYDYRSYVVSSEGGPSTQVPHPGVGYDAARTLESWAPLGGRQGIGGLVSPVY